MGRVRIDQNVHIYENGHNRGQKWVSRHSTGNLMRIRMRYFPGFIGLICLIFFNIGDGRIDKNPKNCHNSGHMGSPWPEFCIHLSFISTNIFLSP